MVARSTRRVALLAIHPPYADAILAGTKKVEFRKRRLADDVDVVLLYATQPVGAIVGAFRVAGQIESSPVMMWRRYGHVGGIDRGSFGSYFGRRASAVGILVGEVRRLPEPLPLPAALGRKTRPPQSVAYLTVTRERILTRVIEMAGKL